ncbi:MAG TPA: NADH-quinone oxidoreductase subunit C [Saprospiraceae bacterium]|nr:NADH-quinone oxidoreductase subunit C [Saprospiraceae bacterium]
MDVTQQDKILTLLGEKYADQILHAGTVFDFFTITLKKDKVVEIIRELYHHPEAQFQYLTTLCGIHYPELEQIAIMYQLHNLYTNVRLRLKIYLPVASPTVPTLTPVFEAANWMERETYDFYGVVFEGHPNLKRILNVDDMIIFPMRKEYPLEDQVRQDKNDSMFGR